jgi:hypothetical protein
VALEDVAWGFIGGVFSDRASFDLSLREYQERGATEAFEPEELAILYPAVRIQYMCWDGEEQVEPVITLTAENGAAFSIGDLLFQIHNAVVAQLQDIDHHFFQGLVLVAPPAGQQPPLYRLCQGS